MDFRVPCPPTAVSHSLVKPPRYRSLDILRGICALTIFLNHWHLWSNLNPRPGFESGVHEILDFIYDAFIALTWPTGGQHPALICFFVLSGFCVHGGFERRMGTRENKIDWRRYFVRRFRRIMPVYWVGGVLGLILVGAMTWRPVFDTYLALHSQSSASQVFARIAGLNGLWLEEVFVGNATLNTVGIEIIIYMAYPLFYFAADRGRWVLLGLIAGGFFLLPLILQPYVNPYVLFGGILVASLFWYFGALAAHLWQIRNVRVRTWWLIVLWAVFLVLNGSGHFFGQSMLKQLIWSLICAGLILRLLAWEKSRPSIHLRAGPRVFRWFGTISYSLYAVHTPLILLVNWSLLAFTINRSYFGQLTLNLLVPMLVAVAVHYAVERRFYKF